MVAGCAAGIDCDAPPKRWLCDACACDGDVEVGSGSEDEGPAALDAAVVAAPEPASDGDEPAAPVAALCYVHPRFVLVHADYRAVLGAIPDHAVHLIATDPPSGACTAAYQVRPTNAKWAW